MSYNEKSGKIEEGKVVETFEHEVDSYLVVNGKLKVTGNHPMFVNDEWTEIGNAEVGDVVKTLNGEEKIYSIEIVNEKVRVYNLEVEGNHNYFAENYLAHNKEYQFFTE